MTNEQATEIITLMYDMAKKSVSTNTSNADALEMAIKALEQKPSREIEDYENEIEDLQNRLNIAEGDKECYKKEIEALETEIRALKNKQTDGDLISRQSVIGIVEFECGEWKGLAKTIVKEIEQLPSAEKTTINPEKTTITDGDLILKQKVLDMLNKIDYEDGLDYKKWVNYVESLSTYSVKEDTAESDGDLISRKAVIGAISNDRYDYWALFKYVKRLPSVTPQKKMGRWINQHIIYDNATIDFKVCSECRYEFSYDAETGVSDANYCPNCGAKMVESEKQNE